MAQKNSGLSTLTEMCFDVIIINLDMYSNLSEVLPVELKERIFAHYTSTIPSTPSPSSFPISSYPEDRYRDVQLVNRITCQRVIPLCFAMWSSLDYRFEKVKRLIEEEACDVNESDLEGFCPLHYAAIYGRVEACKLLLSHGADCTRRNNFGKTPADLAQDHRVQQMIKLRANLFRTDEMKELEADLAAKRRHIAEQQRRHLREEFLRESKHISRLLQRREEQIQQAMAIRGSSGSSHSPRSGAGNNPSAETGDALDNAMEGSNAPLPHIHTHNPHSHPHGNPRNSSPAAPSSSSSTAPHPFNFNINSL